MNRGSVSDFRQSQKSDPLPDVICLLCMQVKQRPTRSADFMA